MVASPLILLTGAGGVVGSAIRRHRGRDVITLAHRGVPAGSVHSVPGDVGSPRLGLAPAEYRDLCGRVSAVVHSAALTGFGASPEAVERVNVTGTGHVARFARDAGVPLHHVSTAFVAVASEGAEATYLASKRRGETLVRGGGGPHLVVRPSIVVGDSRTGEIAHHQAFHRVLAALMAGHLPLLPAADGALVDFVSNDHVAECVWHAVDHGIAGDRVLWLTAGRRALSVAEIVELALRFAAEVGREVAPPRVMTPDVIERLVRPVFAEHLPGALLRGFERVANLAAMLSVARPFPSEWCDPLVGGGFPEPRPPRQVLLANLAGWARATGYGPAELIDRALRRLGDAAAEREVAP